MIWFNHFKTKYQIGIPSEAMLAVCCALLFPSGFSFQTHFIHQSADALVVDYPIFISTELLSNTPITIPWPCLHHFLDSLFDFLIVFLSLLIVVGTPCCLQHLTNHHDRIFLSQFCNHIPLLLW